MFATLTVLAPGLLGGSVAQAARARGLAASIRVWSRRPETRAGLRAAPWCDTVCDTPEDAVSGAGFVVVCAPVDQIVPLVQRIAPALAQGTLVTDVGSVKGSICRPAADALGARAHFVGSHPMAGSDRSGHAHADPGLFRDRTCFVTPLSGSDPAAVERVAAFWRATGAAVAIESPERHDEIVAHVSHLPHVAASALCCALAREDPAWRSFAGPGLRDTTRIAASDPELWTGILRENRSHVLRALRHCREELAAVEAAIEAEDWAAVRGQLERGRRYREGLRS